MQTQEDECCLLGVRSGAGLSAMVSPNSRYLLELEGQKDFDYQGSCELLAILLFKTSS